MSQSNKKQTLEKTFLGIVEYMWWTEDGHTFYTYYDMMPSLHGNAFHSADTLWRESTSHWWIPLTKGQQYGALMFPLLLTCTGCWTNNKVDDDLMLMTCDITVRQYYHTYSYTPLFAKSRISQVCNTFFNYKPTHILLIFFFFSLILHLPIFW